jgi:Ca-activated chloride channel family protein
MELPDRVVKGQQVTRLAVVKKAALRFVQERPDDKIGLILFGSQAYLQTPLTYDHKNVEMRLEDATVGLAGKSTSIGDALGLAVKNLQQVSPKGRVIILLTDGVNNSGVLTPQKAAEFAQMEGIKVYTIGLGSDEMVNAFSGAFFQMGLGQPDLDEDTLKEVARKTGGRYFRATDLQSLDRIYDQINQLEATEQSSETVRPQQEYYPWLLALALMCSFIGLMLVLHRRMKR